MSRMNGNEQKLFFTAEEVRLEQEQINDIFLTVTFRMCDTTVNRNREAVTAEFIHSVVENPAVYDGLPLYCDTSALLAGQYTHLTHRYDRQNRTFATEQIGSFVRFWEEEKDGVLALYAEARIPKRQEEICENIVNLYNLGLLNVSYEVCFDPNTQTIQDGARWVDAGPDNLLHGAAIVSIPAYRSSSALDLVAEASCPEDTPVETESAETEVSTLGDQKEIVAEEQNAEVINHSMEVTERYHESNEPGELPVHVTEIHETIVETVEPEPAPEPVPVPPVQPVNPSVPVLAEEKTEEEEKPAEEEPAAEEPAEEPAEETPVEEPAEEEEPREEAREEDKEDEEDKDEVIAELRQRIAELEEAKAELDKIKEERRQAEIAEKRNRAKTFAEAQGLNPEDENVAVAIAELDWEKIASLSMDKATKPETHEDRADIVLANYIETEICGSKYGDILSRRN